MIRWADAVGLAGMLFVLLSIHLLFPDSIERMNWVYWLGGLLLWFMGAISVVGWLLVRWSVRNSKDAPPPMLVWSFGRPKKGHDFDGTHKSA